MKTKSQKGNQGTKRPYILIDCSVLVYAAYNAYGTLSYDGKSTGVIYGFLAKILGIAEIFNTNNFIFCWDSKNLHRTRDYPGYKEKRDRKKNEMSEEELGEYFSMVEQKRFLKVHTLPLMGFRNSFCVDGYEADDLLAIWARKLSKNHRVIMVTSDADMYQCLDCCSIYNPRKKSLYVRELFEKEYGIKPDQWAMAKAIGGCSGDEVIGIKGVSDPKKSTSKALKYLTNNLTKGEIFKRITSDEGQAIIKKNLPIVTTPYREDELPRMILKRNKFSKSGFISAFEKYGFYSFLKSKKFNCWKEYFLDE